MQLVNGCVCCEMSMGQWLIRHVRCARRDTPHATISAHIASMGYVRCARRDPSHIIPWVTRSKAQHRAQRGCDTPHAMPLVTRSKAQHRAQRGCDTPYMIPWLTRHMCYCICAAMMALGVMACESNSDQEMSFVDSVRAFSDGMEYFDQDAPETRQLLMRFLPRIFVAADSLAPLDFYAEYLPDTVASIGDTVDIVGDPRTVTPRYLRAIADIPGAYLDYQPDFEQAMHTRNYNPPLYGRIYGATFSYAGKNIDLLFLKYNAVFAYSGLPAGISKSKQFAANLIGNSKEWHELDIHGAIHVILSRQDLRPVGVLLAQHNHHRLYMRGRDFEWPLDNRVAVSYSSLSNEPYLIAQYADIPNTPSVVERTVGNPFHVDFLFNRSDKEPFSAGYDVIVLPAGGAQELSPTLALIPLDDPLYTASISLGARRKLLGIFELFYLNGPPGMDYYTLPPLSNLVDLATFWNVDPQDERFFLLSQRHMSDFSSADVQPILEHQYPRFYAMLQQITIPAVWYSSPADN